MKKILVIVVVMFGINNHCFAQNNQELTIDDIQPKQNNNKNHITASSGKVNTSIPIVNIQSRGLSYPVSLNYNGTDVFDQAQYLNRYKPTSTIGVGWSLGTPKIVVDNKNTGTREDDTFYLSGSKLICTKKNISTSAFGYTYWEFQSKSFQPWIIKYYISRNDVVFDQFNNVIIINTPLDHWEITNEFGVTYNYGKTIDNFGNNSKEKIIAWGNWIGDSNQNGGQNQTLIWNLSSIEDQWLNKIDFEYELQESSLSGNVSLKQTEASYISKITSSTGQNLKFNYASKNDFEFYEPHIEQLEPDAYQERYEKMYLKSIESYNNSSNLNYTFKLKYDISNEISLENRKRYLVEFIKLDKNNIPLPSHEFEYYLEGDFKGGVKSIIDPLGGSITYNYNKKILFTNSSKSAGSQIDFQRVANYTGDNYHLSLLHEYDVNNRNSGYRRTKIARASWKNNNDWVYDYFEFPEELYYRYDNNNIKDIEKVKFVLKNNFYGVLTYRDNNVKLYLFHLNKDGITWNSSVFNNIDTDTYSANSQHNPSFISGSDFVAIGSHKNGKLHTYVWNGSDWNQKTIFQGNNNGQYYYQATNNYIISMNENRGTDYITGGYHDDLYYIHYLDATKKFISKSWSQSIDPYVTNTVDDSYFYTSNGMATFVADNNPELFLRWDNDYNIIGVDDVLGSFNDLYPVSTMNNSLFTIHKNNIHFTAQKTARFNGNNWSELNLNFNEKNYGSPGLGLDKILVSDGYNEYYLNTFNPNTNSWSEFILPRLETISFMPNSTGLTSNFFITGNYAYKLTNNGYDSLGITDPIFLNAEGVGGRKYTASPVLQNSNGNIFARYRLAISSSVQTITQKFMHINKINGELIAQNEGDLPEFFYWNWIEKFGGSQPFLSNTVFGEHLIFKIINNKINSDVFDIVVDEIITNNSISTSQITNYTYNDFKYFANNKVIYGEVTIENKGYGNSTLGKAKKYFNTGDADIQMAGLPIKEVIEDEQGNIKQQKESTWQKFSKDYSNSEGVIGSGQYLRIINQNELVNLDNSIIESETINLYNTYGLLYDTSVKNSNDQWNNASSTFAYEQYSFLEDKNMLSMPFEKVTKKNGTTTSVEQIKWIQDNGNVYPYENWSGTSSSSLRLNSKTTTVTNQGIVVEAEDGLGKYNSILFGYNYLYEVAKVSNVKYIDVINSLDVSISALQNLSTENLKIELLKLYDRLPNALISLKLYDDNGNVITEIDNRKEEINYFYDSQNRIENITDSDGFVLKKYNYHNQKPLPVIINEYTITSNITGSGTVTHPDIVEEGDNVNININPNSGYEISSIRVNNIVQPNSTSFTIVNVTSDLDIEVIFSVIQNFSVSPTHLFFDIIDGIQTINVTASGAWTITKSASWIILSTTSGNNTGSFTVRPLKNLGTQRLGKVTVTNNGVSKIIWIEQTGSIDGGMF